MSSMVPTMRSFWRFVRAPYFLAFLFGLTPWLLAWVTSSLWGFRESFLKSPVFPLASFCISWVLLWVHWGLLKYEDILREMKSCFKDEAAFETDLQFATRFVNRRLLWFCLSCVLFIGGIAQYSHYVSHPEVNQFGWFAEDWFCEHVLGKWAITIIFGIPSSYALGKASWMFITNALFLWRIRKLKVLPLPGVLIARLRRVTTFYLIAGFAWYVGVAAIVVVSAQHLSTPIPGLVLVLVNSLGLITALGPQFLFRMYLRNASAEMAEVFIVEYRTLPTQPVTGTRLQELTSMLQASQPVPLWVINLKDLSLLALGQFFPQFYGPLKSFIITRFLG